MSGIRKGIHESRTGLEDCVGGGGFALFGFNLSVGDLYVTRTCVVHDVQSLCHARGFLASGNPQPIGESQPDRLHGMVQLRSRRGYGHTGIARHDFTWRTDRCGDARSHRGNLDRVRTSEPAYGGLTYSVAVINHIASSRRAGEVDPYLSLTAVPGSRANRK